MQAICSSCGSIYEGITHWKKGDKLVCPNCIVFYPKGNEFDRGKKKTTWANWQQDIYLTAACPKCDNYQIYKRKALEELGIESENYLMEGREFEFEATCDDCGEEFIINELING